MIHQFMTTDLILKSTLHKNIKYVYLCVNHSEFDIVLQSFVYLTQEQFRGSTEHRPHLRTEYDQRQIVEGSSPT